MTTLNRIVIESGTKKSFASALDWPGWSRSGKSDDKAIATLITYGDRYRKVASRAGATGIDNLIASHEVVERIAGTGATDFGVPDKVAAADHEWMSADDCDRHIAILQACWDEFDAIAAQVSEELQNGPRGGGRDRSAIVEHTLGADRGYARRIGVMTPAYLIETPAGLVVHREEVVAAIRQQNTERTGTKWPLRYFIRRAAWHLLDHAWEMEDKDLSGIYQGKVIHASPN